MSSQPWWHGDDPTGAAPGRSGAGDDLFAGAAEEARRLAESPQAQAAMAAVQETVAGGLSLVAAFMRAAVDPGPVAGSDAEPVTASAAASDAAPASEPWADDPAPGPHLTGECRSCPVCQGLALLREVNPALVEGLGDALEAMTATVRSWSRVQQPADDGPSPR